MGVISLHSHLQFSNSRTWSYAKMMLGKGLKRRCEQILGSKFWNRAVYFFFYFWCTECYADTETSQCLVYPPFHPLHTRFLCIPWQFGFGLACVCFTWCLSNTKLTRFELVSKKGMKQLLSAERGRLFRGLICQKELWTGQHPAKSIGGFKTSRCSFCMTE